MKPQFRVRIVEGNTDMEYGTLRPCPVDGCEGFRSTSDRWNLNQHLRSTAANECLLDFLLGVKTLSHAQYLKEHLTVETYQVSKMRIDEKHQVLLKLGIRKEDQ